MPLIAFNTQVLSSVSNPRPALTPYTVTAASNTVTLSSLGAIGGKQVLGYAFNALTSPVTGTGVTAGLSAGTSRVVVDTAYNRATFAVIFTDRTSSLFTVATGASTTAQSLTANDTNTVFPEIQQLVRLGYL